MRKAQTLDVIFRAERDTGEVTAVFPSLPGTSPHDFTVYVHHGQHSTGSFGWYDTTRPATPDEYADLLAELRGIYEHGDEPATLRVVKRWRRRHDDARTAACS